MTDHISLLDHGYIKLVEHWGSDERIIEAARMSTDKGFKGWGSPDAPGDEKLLRYLYENKHATPFEMAGLTIEVQAPIFVFRQWHRHRTQSYNEMSARYTPLPSVDYMPTVERCIVIEGSNKQAGKTTARTPTHVEALAWLEMLARSYACAEIAYQYGLEIGIQKELARVCLPVARYSRMRASANLRNWIAFMTLRWHSHAQHEIKVYADALGQYIQQAFPRTWELFAEHHDGG